METAARPVQTPGFRETRAALILRHHHPTWPSSGGSTTAPRVVLVVPEAQPRAARLEREHVLPECRVISPERAATCQRRQRR